MTTTILTHSRVTWTNIVQPTLEDMDQLKSRYPHFHPLNLHDCTSELEFPKIDHHDGYLFIVVHLPRWDSQERISRPSEVDIFVGKGILVTSHAGILKPLNELFARLQQDEALRNDLMGHGASPLLYELLDELINYCFPILQKVNQNIRHAEEHLFHEETEHILRDIAIVRRDVIALRHILRPQWDVFDALEKGNWPFIHDDLTLYWSNLGDHLAQLKAMLDEHMDVIDGLSDTIDTLASHRIDGVMRVLTFITILTAPLTLMATIFGINVELLPVQYHPLLFLGVIIIGILLTLVLIVYLNRRGFL
ncbi:MAG: magnesium transporter CorA family protein [Ardenticatenaceae bacterium]|nr:magnesium transporter CorA family protein [Ardenticatenaceae bacterium]MCB8989266.1 magnesium transporter CorA family protein [Ardenticatenaceae bacterium]